MNCVSEEESIKCFSNNCSVWVMYLLLSNEHLYVYTNTIDELMKFIIRQRIRHECKDNTLFVIQFVEYSKVRHPTAEY